MGSANVSFEVNGRFIHTVTYTNVFWAIATFLHGDDYIVDWRLLDETRHNVANPFDRHDKDRPQ